MSLTREPALGTGDADLIARVRDGDLDAYGVLYERHHDAALALARQISRSTADADDLVADAFARVLTAIGNGNGPTESFRPYLLTAVRRRAYDRTDRAHREELVEDPAEDGTFAEMVAELEHEDHVDQSLATTAFLTLPERWQAVLWHTEIEESSPGEVGELLGINANATSVLAHRAREGLRQAYLQAHLSDAATAASCSSTVERMGAFVRGGLAKRAVAKVEHHLHECARCRGLRDELSDLNTTLRRTVAPAVLGPAAGAYLLLQRSGESAAAAGAAATATSAGAGKVAVLAAAAIAVVGLVTTTAVRSDALPGMSDPPERQVLEATALTSTSAGDDGAATADTDAGGDGDARVDGPPEEAPLPGGIEPVQLPVGICSTAMAVGETEVPAEGGGEVTGAALLWNDGSSAAPGLDLPATTTLVTDALEGTLQHTFAFVTDVSDALEGGACGLGSVLTQLPDQDVGQWVLVLATDTVDQVVDAAVDLVEGVVDEADEAVAGLTGVSVTDTVVGGALEQTLADVDATVDEVVAALQGLGGGDAGVVPPNTTPGGGSGGAEGSGGSSSGGGSSGGSGSGGSGGGGAPAPAPAPAPPPSPNTTVPNPLAPVTDPLIGDGEGDTPCGVLAKLLGQC